MAKSVSVEPARPLDSAVALRFLHRWKIHRGLASADSGCRVDSDYTADSDYTVDWADKASQRAIPAEKAVDKRAVPDTAAVPDIAAAVAGRSAKDRKVERVARKVAPDIAAVRAAKDRKAVRAEPVVPLVDSGPEAGQVDLRVDLGVAAAAEDSGFGWDRYRPAEAAPDPRQSRDRWAFGRPCSTLD